MCDGNLASLACQCGHGVLSVFGWGLDVSCVRVGVVELKLLRAHNQTDNVGLTASTARECKLQLLCKGRDKWRCGGCPCEVRTGRELHCMDCSSELTNKQHNTTGGAELVEGPWHPLTQ
jgi:hypothetical protein